MVTESLSASIIYLLPLSLLFVSFAATVTKGFPNTEVSKINEILGDFIKKKSGPGVAMRHTAND